MATKNSSFLLSLVVLSLAAMASACESETSASPCSTKGGLPATGNLFPGLLATGNVFGVLDGKLIPLEGAIVTLKCDLTSKGGHLINLQQSIASYGQYKMSAKPYVPILNVLYCLISVLESSLPSGFNVPVSNDGATIDPVSSFTVPSTPSESPYVYKKDFYYSKA